MVASQAAERRAVLIAEGDPVRPEFDRVLMEEEFALIKPPVDNPRWLPAALEHLDGYVLFRSDKRLAGTEDAFLESIREYLRRSDLPRPACVPAAPLFDDVAGDVSDDDPMATIDAVAACVAGKDANLRDNEIVRKEVKVAQARLEAIQTFKEDFVSKMRGAFDVMDGLLGELNRQLHKRSFHGLAYRFARQEAPGYRDMTRSSSGRPILGWRKPLLILTVENLTSFHRQVREARQADVCVVYTGGFPSLTVIRVLRHLLRAAPTPPRLFHWGDVDAGGARIGGHLEDSLEVLRSFRA